MKLIPTTLEQIITENNPNNRYVAFEKYENAIIGSEWLSDTVQYHPEAYSDENYPFVYVDGGDMYHHTNETLFFKMEY